MLIGAAKRARATGSRGVNVSIVVVAIVDVVTRENIDKIRIPSHSSAEVIEHITIETVCLVLGMIHGIAAQCGSTSLLSLVVVNHVEWVEDVLNH